MLLQILPVGFWPAWPFQHSVRRELPCGNARHRSDDKLRRPVTTQAVKSSTMRVRDNNRRHVRVVRAGLLYRD